MADFSIPDEKNGFTQANKSDVAGNVYMTYGVDFDNGTIRTSAQSLKLISQADNPAFNGYMCAIVPHYQEIIGVSDAAFSASTDDIFGTWTESIAGAQPDSGNEIMDATFFDGLVLVTEAEDIKAWNGTTWSSWWEGTLGQASLAVGDRHIIWTGSDGNAYIVDGGNKVYRVTTTGTVSTTGDGTLDFSATKYKISCAGTTSTRSFIGTIDETGEEAVIVEWDMAATSETANRLHPIGAKGVLCIAVWGDTAVAVLSNGKLKYFDGLSFVDFKKSVRFPIRDGYELADDFIHPNGWAIIDDLPHFLVSGKVNVPSINLAQSKQADYRTPSGVWCLDPAIGLYHRFALGTGLSTQEDYGKMQLIKTGALYSTQKTDGKFLASYEYALNDESDTRSVLVYHDASNTKPSRSFLMTTYAQGFKRMWKQIELFCKKLNTGEKVRVYYRQHDESTIGVSGTWSSKKNFNIVGTNLGFTKGNMCFVKMGRGSGQLFKIDEIAESETVTTLSFTEENSFITAGDLGVLDVLNFRYMGEVTNTTKDYHALTIPEQGMSRKTQILFEFQQNAGNIMETDFVLIT